jgi:hypothetical protein
MKKLLVVGIIVQLVGVSVPSTGINNNSSEINDGTDSLKDSFLYVSIDRINKDGHLTFNITNYCSEDIEDITINIEFYGSSPITNLNKVNVNTEIIIENLSIGESGLFKTEDRIFKVRFLINRPLVFYFNGAITMELNDFSKKTYIRKLIGFWMMNEIFIPYP